MAPCPRSWRGHITSIKSNSYQCGPGHSTVLHSSAVFRLLRSLVALAILVSLAYCGATVKLGKYTAFGHVKRIWGAEETQDMVDGVKETSEPVVDKVKRGVKAGYEEMTRDDDEKKKTNKMKTKKVTKKTKKPESPEE